MMPEPASCRITLEKGVLVCRFTLSAEAQAAPEAHLFLGGKQVATALATRSGAEIFEARFRLPAAAQQDGAMVLDVYLAGDARHLGRYTIMNGQPPSADLASSVAMLEAELQALKRAFMADGSVPKLTTSERPLLVAEAVQQALAAVNDGASPDADS